MPEVNCITCGKEFHVWLAKLKNGKGKYCSPECYHESLRERIGPKSSSWKGGMKDRGIGYRAVWVPGHKRATHGYVYEHIIVAEELLGRDLLPSEQVHHINGDRADNRRENIHVCKDNAEHSRIHADMRIRSMGGDPCTQKICSHCKGLIERTEFHRNKSNYDGLDARCKSCDNLRHRLDHGEIVCQK